MNAKCKIDLMSLTLSLFIIFVVFCLISYYSILLKKGKWKQKLRKLKRKWQKSIVIIEIKRNETIWIIVLKNNNNNKNGWKT